MKSKPKIIVQVVHSCVGWCPYFKDGEGHLYCRKMGKEISLFDGDYIPPECPLKDKDQHDYEEELNHLLSI